MPSIVSAPLSGSLDSHTYRELYGRLRSTVRYHLGKTLNSREDVDDCMQEVFLVLVDRLRNGATFPTTNHLMAFLRLTARNIARTFRINQGKAFHRTAGFDDSTVQVAADVTPTDTQALLRDVLRRLSTARDALSPVHRRLLDGLIEEESHDELAAALGGSADTARVRTHRFRNALRARVPEVNEALSAAG